MNKKLPSLSKFIKENVKPGQRWRYRGSSVIEIVYVYDYNYVKCMKCETGFISIWLFGVDNQDGREAFFNDYEYLVGQDKPI